MSLFFFALFALNFVGMYLIVRRGQMRTRGVALVGTIISIVTMFLFAKGQNAEDLHALLVVAIPVGVVFSAAAIAIASFFNRAEAHTDYEQPVEAPDSPPQST